MHHLLPAIIRYTHLCRCSPFLSCTGDSTTLSPPTYSVGSLRSLSACEFLTLSEEVVTGNTLVVTIIHNARFEDAMFSEWQAETNMPDKTSFEDLPAEEQLKVFQKTYEVHIDSAQIQTPAWTFKSERLFDSFFSPNVVKMRCRVNVESLSDGIHELRIRLALEDADVMSITGQKKRGHVGKQDFYVDR
jgi:hypothetical protein